MYQLNEDQVDFILSDIRKKGIDLEDLQYDLLDHVCCIIENEFSGQSNFEQFYEDTIARFFRKELREVQDETKKLLTFKDYYAMKRILNITGFTAGGFIVIGAIFRMLEISSANVLMLLGAVIFGLLFLPLAAVLKFQDEATARNKFVFVFGTLIGIAATFGILFKLMYWPYANVLMRGSLMVFMGLFVPTYFFVRLREATSRFNTMLSTILMLVGGGMMLTLSNPKISVNMEDCLYSVGDFLETNTADMQAINEDIADKLAANDRKIEQMRLLSGRIDSEIGQIKAKLISESEQVSLETAGSMTIADLRNPYNSEVVQAHFAESTGELSMQSLQELLQAYNQELHSLLPEGHRYAIPYEKLQMDRTIVSVLLYELTHIQYLVANNENRFLNQYLGSVEPQQ